MRNVGYKWSFKYWFKHRIGKCCVEQAQQNSLGLVQQHKLYSFSLHHSWYHESVWFRLTVEDSHHATNSTTANITVLKVTDYPPEANAGQDTIIYLPHNNLTLSGILSTDDRGIFSWEWTKSPSDQDKAVDMQVQCCLYLEQVVISLQTLKFTAHHHPHLYHVHFHYLWSSHTAYICLHIIINYILLITDICIYTSPWVWFNFCVWSCF